ncbi:hypothetical protein DERP_003251 [Dermatophagoides pteronyssinus]|uniref:Uncharacterized protein n=1 Tax=Dermatophagoides pteronyssinus TaxID=6956 RepID=A0ABQ8JJ04_DERPT|nr:hypothetical protein DERP_003251 [Dermatophagoides pteronyssinus]
MSIQYVIRTYHSIESDISMKNEMDNLIDVQYTDDDDDITECFFFENDHVQYRRSTLKDEGTVMVLIIDIIYVPDLA